MTPSGNPSPVVETPSHPSVGGAFFAIMDNVGDFCTHALALLGSVTLTLIQSAVFIAKGKIRWTTVVEQMAKIGVDSLPVVILICVIAGSVLALQTAQKFAQTGADAYVGGLVALAIVREIAPIFTCLAVGARAGTAIASEIANMQVTEQVAALRILHVHPVRYLVVPRLLACIFTMPLLTVFSEVVGILGGMLVAKSVSNLHYFLYLDSVWLYLGVRDIQVSLYKAVIFGIILAGITCAVGLSTRGGAKDVGVATTRAAVWTAMCILIADFFLTWIFFGTSFDGT